MMLPPFRIRHLYLPDHGVIQITARQYDSTIVSQPDAALTYLDDDDGEVITVGSSYELGQRLDEPVLHNEARPTSYPLDPDTPMHVFDIKHTAASLATWREHEAYASKNLRTRSQSAESTQKQPQRQSQRDQGMWTTDQNGRPVYDRYVERDPEDYTVIGVNKVQEEPAHRFSMREDGPRSPILNFDTASFASGYPRTDEVPAADVERNSASRRLSDVTLEVDGGFRNGDDFANYVLGLMPADSQPPANTPITGQKPAPEAASTINEVKEDNVIGLEQIVTNALQGLDTHFAGFADFLHSTSNGLRDAADKTRDTDISAVEGVLDGFMGILGEVGKIGRSMLETFDTEASAIVKEVLPLVAEALQKTLDPEKPASIQQPETSGAQMFGSNQVEQSVPVVVPQIPLPTEPTAFTRVSQLETLRFKPIIQNSISKRQEDRRTAVAEASRKEENIDQPKLSHASDIPPGYRLMNDCPAGPLPITKLKKPSEPTGWAEKASIPTTWNHEVRDCHPHGTVMRLDPVERQVIAEESTTPGSHPKELLKQVSTMSKSILDLETSDPDFSVRYPPLMSLRRARTVAGLNERSILPPGTALNTQTALSRYPSIDQLEKNPEKKSTENVDAVRKCPDANARPSVLDVVREAQKFVSPPMAKPAKSDPAQGVTVEEVDDIDLPLQKKTTGSRETPLYSGFVENSFLNEANELLAEKKEASIGTQRLPGAWPETTADSQMTDYPLWNESSGAFFDRMTRNRPVSGPNQAVETPKDVRPLTTRRGRAYRYVDPLRSEDMYTRPEKVAGLQRSQTVTALNPAARLTRPFDPLVPNIIESPDGRPRFHAPLSRPSMPLFPHEPTDMPRRSGTERRDRHRQQWHEPSAAGIRQQFDPFAAEPSSQQVPPRPEPAFLSHGSRSVRSVPHFTTPSVQPYDTDGGKWSGPGIPQRSATTSTRSKVDECILQLRRMGYGANDGHEASRLHVYAGAASGNVLEALDMIEEDRKGSWQAWVGRKKEEGSRRKRSLDGGLI